MAAPAAGTAPPSASLARYGALAPAQRAEAEAAARDLTDAVHEGLDLGGEFRTVAARSLGDTLLLWESSRLAGLAVCHWGPASEAGAGNLFVKFGAVRPGPGAADRFDTLLDGCAALARETGMAHVFAGVSTAREEAYRQMIARGFRSRAHVVTMHRPNEPAYSRPGAYVLDDWR
jgi:hypothetical protein